MMNNIDLIKNLTKELLGYCDEYYNKDAPSIADAEYDAKFDTLKKLEDENNFWLSNSPTRKVQGDILPFLEKVKHSVPMLSADKSTNITDVEKFINNKKVVASYKLDGSTVVVKYKDGKFIQGLSRGSGFEGENITHTVKMIKNLPMTIPYKGYLEIRGEALIPWKLYNEMNTDGALGHPRNVASGGLRQLNANEASKRNIYFYAFTLVNWKEVGVTSKTESLKFLSNNGFDVVPNILIPDVSLEKAVKTLDRKTYGNPTDGWCFEYDDLVYGESLGSTEHHDRRLFALKPAQELVTTNFRKVDYKTCRTGIVSLTAEFDPVEISNTIVSRATLHNCDIFNNLELGVGDVISVAKFNEIIPGVVDNLTRSGTYKLIDRCPSCGSKLEIKNTGTANFLYCPNDNCPAKQLARFTHFVSRKCMNIENLSEKTLELLISNNLIKNFRDIYHLKEHVDKLCALDGMGKKSVENLLNSIEKSRNVDLAHYLTALGIPGIGLSAAKAISKKFNGDHYDFVQALSSGYDFSQIDDFGEITNKSLHDWWNNKDQMVELLPMEMNFIVENNSSSNVNLNGKSFCITGSLSYFTNRDALVADIESRGGKFVSSVSSKCNYLINNDLTSTSSKNKKALSLNIPIITEEEYLVMCGDNIG